MRRSVVALLKDRRRRQRGSVLSAVLIMVAFLAIIAGALLTSLSDNFLLAHALVNRTANEATIDSGMELALSGLQDTRSSPLFNGCPGLTSLALNGLAASESYASCYPVIDRGSSQNLRAIVSGGKFQDDGTHASVPAAGVDAYLAGDSSGNVFAVPTGTVAAAWSYALGGEVVGPPLAMADASTSSGVSYLVPVENPTLGQAAGCATDCVALLSATGSGPPSLTCLMPANAVVAAEPAAGNAFPADAYFGDASGLLFAYSAIAAYQTPTCDQEATYDIGSNVPGTSAVVAGPFVINGSTSKRLADEIYAVVTAGTQSFVVHYTYALNKRFQPAFTYGGSIALPGAVTGASFQPSSSEIAVGFASGRVALVKIQSDFSIALLGSVALGSPVTDAPFWNGTGQIGVAAGSTLYVLNPGLSIASSFAAPSAISGSPAADLGGDWFVGTSSGWLYEAQAVAGSAQMAQRAAYGGAGSLTSTPMAFRCSTGSIGICIYAGSSDGDLYFAGLDARHALVDSCISACGLTNSSLRADVEVGDANSPRTVHVLGWSYYSP